jgi:hypothetical protein
MADSDNNDKNSVIKDLIYDAIDTRAKPVDVLSTLYFPGVRRPGIIFKPSELAGKLPLHLFGLGLDEISSGLC